MLLLAVVMSACSHGAPRRGATDAGGPTPTPTASARAIDAVPGGRVRVAWQRRLLPVIRPAVAGDVAVAVVQARGDELDIVGIGVDDGRVRWRYPYYTPDALHSSYFWPPVFRAASGKQYAVFQRAEVGAGLAADQPKPYLAVDPDTGRIVARTKPLVALWHAVPCDGGRVEVDVCLDVHGAGSNLEAELEWHLDDFSLRRTPDDQHAGPAGVYTVFGRRGIATVGRKVSGRGWSRRTRALVGPRWEVDERSATPIVDDGVVVISASRRASASQERRFHRGERVPFDRGANETLGLDLHTGRVMWKHEGGELGCPSVTGVEAPVRCVFRGHFLFDEQWHGPRLKGIRLAIEGFDPATGDPTWSVPLTRAAAGREARQEYARSEAPSGGVIVGDEVGWLPTASGPRLVAWSDGSSREVPGGSVLLCDSSRQFRYATDDGPWQTRGTDTFGLCTQAGDRGSGGRGRVAGPPSAADLAVAGVPAGQGRYLVAFENRLVAYSVT
jgi:hypothetical protein